MEGLGEAIIPQSGVAFAGLGNHIYHSFPSIPAWFPSSEFGAKYCNPPEGCLSFFGIGSEKFVLMYAIRMGSNLVYTRFRLYPLL